MRDENDFVERKKNGNGREGVGDKKKWQRVEKSMKRWNISEVLEQGQEDMISHDTQLCLAEPEEPKRWREKKETKRGKMGGKDSLRKRNKSWGQDRQTTFPEWSQCPFIKKTASPSKPVFVHKGKRTVTTSSGHAVCWCWHNRAWCKMWKLIFLQSTFFPHTLIQKLSS